MRPTIVKTALLCFVALLLTSSNGVEKTNKSLQYKSLDEVVNQLMEKYKVPGVSIAMLNGQGIETSTYGVLQAGKDAKIDPETMFSVGSLSKTATAVVALRLVHQGKLSLDEDINNYLKRWKVPKGENSQDQAVTIRHILSHTAGFSVHGFADYRPGEEIPTLLQILNGEAPAKSGKVELIFPVGTDYKYSGGGTTVLQLIIEDVTGKSFQEASEELLFKPLSLTRASFENPLPETWENVAKAHNNRGKPVALPRGYQAMPEAAASGLWITPSLYLKMLSSLLDAHNGKDTGFLSRDIVEDMITSERNSRHGLAPVITNNGDHLIVEHTGSNDSYKAIYRIFWKEKKGFIVFTNSSFGGRLFRDLQPHIEEYLGIEKSED